MKVVGSRILASMAIVSTALSLGGFAAVPTALAAAPADYGLHEGDVISADGVAGSVGYDPDLYIVNDWGYKRLFLNPVIFNFYGHLGGFAAVKHVAPATRDAFPTSGLFRNCETGEQAVWGVEVTGEDTGVLHHIALTGDQAVSQDPNFFKKVFCINSNEANWYPKGADYTNLNQVPDYTRGGTGATPTPTTGGLNGGAGALQDANEITSLQNEEVGEGENNIPVAGLNLEADSGSDLRVLSVRVSFEEQGAGGSNDLDDYSDVVSLWFNGSKVAQADVADFNEDAGVWSKSISLTSDAIVRMNQVEDLKVAVSALDNVDSADLNANNDWQVTIENVRYVDAQGAITTDDATGDLPLTESYNYVDFATAADLELALNEASDNPDARVVDVDNSTVTENAVLLTGTLEATGDLMVKELTVNIASDSVTGVNFTTIADNLKLEVGGDVRQELSTTDCTGAGVGVAAVCVFDNVDEAIADGDSVKIRVLADINGTDDIGEQGATLTADIDNSDTDVEDENGDQLPGADKTGTAVGNEQAFYDNGIMVTFDSASESKVSADAAPDQGTFVIKFKVKSFGDDAYIEPGCTASGSNGVVFEDRVNSGAWIGCSLTSTADIGSSSSTNFEVLEGATATFTVTAVANGNDAFWQAGLLSISWSNQDVSNPATVYDFNLDDFETDPLFLSST